MNDDGIEFAPERPTVLMPEGPSTWLIDAADLLAEPDPGPTPMLVDGLIVDQALIAIVGRWKTTKSYGVLDVCIAVATGRPAFGVLAVPNPGAVVFVNEESGRAALWRRLDALCRGRAQDPEELRAKLYVAANARVKLDDPGWQNELLNVGRELQPRLFVFDPLARMKAAGRKESASDEMGEVIDFWRLLRDETGAAVGVVHHTGHQGDHMRGTSDLESVWETRLAWKRETPTSPLVTVEVEHREAEGSDALSYRINWDGLTRSMRFDLEPDALETKVAVYLRDNPTASANEVYEHVGGKRTKVLELVRQHQEQGGSHGGNHPGTTPAEAPPRGGSPPPPFRGAGTTSEAPGSQDGNHPSTRTSFEPTSKPPFIGDPGYVLQVIDPALADGHITEKEARMRRRIDAAISKALARETQHDAAGEGRQEGAHE